MVLQPRDISGSVIWKFPVWCCTCKHRTYKRTRRKKLALTPQTFLLFSLFSCECIAVKQPNNVEILIMLLYGTACSLRERIKAHNFPRYFCNRNLLTFSIFYTKDNFFVTGLSPAAKIYSRDRLRGRALKIIYIFNVCIVPIAYSDH